MTESPKKIDTKNEDYFVIKYTRNEDVAREIAQFLERQHISVILQDEDDDIDFNGYALLVPEDNVEEAQILIESEMSISDGAQYMQDEFLEQEIDFSFLENEF